MNNNLARILSPAGDMERLKTAVDFGADEVYLAGREFGMRSSPANFTDDELESAIKYAHSHGVQVYLTCNTLPRNDEVSRMPAFIEKAASLGVDAFIVADIGTMGLVKRYASGTNIHVSTQAGIVNYLTAREFYDMGANRVILARELSLDDIATIRAKTHKNLEIEVFVHGAMCVSFSGRCLISSYLTGRDANRGDCAQPCRWKYSLVEEKRPGMYMPVIEDDTGTHFFNAEDMCMIEYIPELLQAGVTSLKIEGRAKSAYYVAVITNAYKQALVECVAKGSDYILPPWILEEVHKVSHRRYCTGFFLGQPAGQVYENGGYIRDYDVVAMCEGYRDGVLELSQRNRFFKGDMVDILQPGSKPFVMKIDNMCDQWGNDIQVAPHAMQKVFVHSSLPVVAGSLLRRGIY